MDTLWAALEASAPAEALKTSFVVYPLVNALHILAVGAVVTLVLLLDLRTLGGFPMLHAAPFIALMRRLALGTFAAAVLSGLLLFAVRASEYAGNPAFLAKMTLLAAAGLNFLLLALGVRGGHAAGATRFGAALSLLLWPAILVAGRFIGFLG